MTLHHTIAAAIDRIRGDQACRPDIERLQGEVLQIKVSGGEEHRIVFRGGTVEVDGDVPVTLHFEGDAEVIRRIVVGELDPFVAILTRRVRATFDPIRGPAIRRLLAAGLADEARDMGWEKVLGTVTIQPGGEH